MACGLVVSVQVEQASCPARAPGTVGGCHQIPRKHVSTISDPIEDFGGGPGIIFGLGSGGNSLPWLDVWQTGAFRWTWTAFGPEKHKAKLTMRTTDRAVFAQFSYSDLPTPEDMDQPRAYRHEGTRTVDEFAAAVATNRTSKQLFAWGQVNFGELPANFPQPPFLKEGGEWFPLVSIGGAGRSIPFHHHDSTMLATIRGSKRWFLAAPNATPSEMDRELMAPPSSWSTQQYNFHYTCDISRGEALYVPFGWWHATINLEDSIAVGYQKRMRDEAKDYLTIFEQFPGARIAEQFFAVQHMEPPDGRIFVDENVKHNPFNFHCRLTRLVRWLEEGGMDPIPLKVYDEVETIRKLLEDMLRLGHIVAEEVAFVLQFVGITLFEAPMLASTADVPHLKKLYHDAATLYLEASRYVPKDIHSLELLAGVYSEYDANKCADVLRAILDLDPTHEGAASNLAASISSTVVNNATSEQHQVHTVNENQKNQSSVDSEGPAEAGGSSQVKPAVLKASNGSSATKGAASHLAASISSTAVNNATSEQYQAHTVNENQKNQSSVDSEGPAEAGGSSQVKPAVLKASNGSNATKGVHAAHFGVPTGYLNNWAYDPHFLKGIQAALKSGRLVSVRNALLPSFAKQIRKELLSLKSSAFVKRTSGGVAAMLESVGLPSNVMWHDNPYACERLSDHFQPAMQQVKDQVKSNIFSQQHMLDDEQADQEMLVPTFSALEGFMMSDEMQAFAAWLVEGEVSAVSTHLAQQQPDDFIAPHKDDLPGRMLTTTLYLSEDSFKAARDGGSFVWCQPYMKLQPRFNSLNMFRVSSRSWHSVEPLRSDFTPTRFAMSTWYTMAGDADELKADKRAQDWALGQTKHSDEQVLIMDGATR